MFHAGQLTSKDKSNCCCLPRMLLYENNTLSRLPHMLPFICYKR